ncbi:DJ-1/PfpI family protein [Fusarium oxysporum]|nr:DJ-1/PfpI family protein [Fusarium oxysporum]
MAPISVGSLVYGYQAIDIIAFRLGLNLDHVHLIADIAIMPSCTVDNSPELDIRIFGRPGPAGFRLDPKFAEYIRHHVAVGKLHFTNCTSAFVAAKAGVLNGRAATVNHIKEKYSTELFTAAAMGLKYEPRNIEGILDIIPKRYDPSGKQISMYVFKYYESY